MFKVDGKNLMFEGFLVDDGKGGAIFVPGDAGSVEIVLEDGEGLVNKI